MEGWCIADAASPRRETPREGSGESVDNPDGYWDAVFAVEGSDSECGGVGAG